LRDGEGAFLLNASSPTGVPEPSNLSLLVLAIPALLRRRPRQHRTLRRSNHKYTTRRPRFETLEDRALLAITVNTLTDELDGSIVDGDISLRDAIAAAPVGETINFSVTGEINLTLGQLTIGQNLTVTGPGANQLTIDAGGASRVLEITTGTVSVSGLTLTGGNGDGGGVLNNGDTTLTGVAIEGNYATTGGGVLNYGMLTIADSEISGNSAGYGGGVFSGNSLTIENSTISGNTAAEGGGVYIYGAISTTISHSTISGNSASNWGGGISSHYANPSSLSHCLITGNSAPTGSEIYSSSSAVVKLNAVNLIGDSSETTAQALSGVTAGATDILATSNGTNPTALAAILGPLANNGGPTMTHALVPGSPAINAGNPAFVPPPDFDQRGAPFTRVAGGRVDIGAFEVQVGDMDFDGDVDFDDIDDFVLGLNDPAAYEALYGVPPATNGDMDGDGDQDFDDIAGFVAALASGQQSASSTSLSVSINSISASTLGAGDVSVAGQNRTPASGLATSAGNLTYTDGYSAKNRWQVLRRRVATSQLWPSQTGWTPQDELSDSETADLWSEKTDWRAVVR
jgi:hypothetical protein